MPAPPSGGSLSTARFAIFVTVAAWLAYVVTTLNNAFFGDEFSLRYALDAVLYLSIVTLLSGSAVAYLLARVGFLYRARRHRREPRAAIDDFFAESIPTLTVIVPSYREDARVIRQTLLSAALQEYPYLRVALLVDDPPSPSDPEHVAQLEAARALPRQIQELLREPRLRYERALEEFEALAIADARVNAEDMRALAAQYDDAAQWLTGLADDITIVDHSDAFLRDEVILRLARELTTVAGAVRKAESIGVVISTARILQLYRRLAWTFRAELTSFERKQYVSLSHEPNKAMNLNSYIGLMGGRYSEQKTPGGLVLVPTVSGPCDLEVPDPDYVLTLDADSILLPEYCLRLVHYLEQPENERVAVAQTPYSAYPGAGTRIERLAGATTDLQHIVHQGLTQYGATFWVGANAVLRKRALDDIGETADEDGFAIRRFIQDRTVIEDTESSIDLGLHGWKLYNYPERLSYSATPPDFGSLCVQRQRWANGGLLVLSKLRRGWREQSHSGAHRRHRLAESFLRANYLASIAWASFGLILLLAYPFNGNLLSPLAILTAFPYFLAMASDLKRCGYKRSDVLRIYGFNLILLPVNVSGVVKSIGQAIGGQKIAFARTPKVRNRTTATIAFVSIPYLVIAFSLFTVWRDLRVEHYPHAVFAGVNAALAAYAVVAFIGLRHSVVDLWCNMVQRLYRVNDAPSADKAGATDWVTVLYHGAGDEAGSGPSAVATPAATLALVGNGSAAADKGDEHAAASAPAHLQPALVATEIHPASSATRDQLDNVAFVITHALRQLGSDGKLVLRMDGSAVEVELKPAE
jgi:cellulose synthase/poly-beta-1,6-N-acetylglucosamine synthase-like glycosyltransferase